ncbi:MAG: hypothetical protein ACRCYP_06565 [Alphaproteobacteria bacterium]
MLILICPFLLGHLTSGTQLFWIQACVVIFSSGFPAYAIFYAHFPVLKRITSVSFIYAVSRAMMYIVTSFGLVYLTSWFGNFGLWVIMVPVMAAFTWSINHFEKLDKPNLEKSTHPLEEAEELLSEAA